MPERPGTVCDKEGHVRLVVPRLDLAAYLTLAIGQLRPYAARDPNAAAHLIRTLKALKTSIVDADKRALVDVELARLCHTTGTEKED